MVNLFQLCCGEGEEEDKYRSLVEDPSAMATELGWTNDVAKENTTERFPNLDHQLSLLLEARRKNVLKDDGTTASSIDNYPAEESSYKVDTMRETIFDRPFEYDPNYEIPIYPKTKDEEQFLDQALQKNFIFATLDKDELQKLIGSMQRWVVSTGTKVIVQGTMGDFFYVVESGRIIFLKGTEEIGTCESGGSFGELALLYATPRAASCVATEPCVLWRTHRTAFQYTLAHNTQYEILDTEKVLRKIALFDGLDEKTIAKFTKTLTPLSWKEGTRIVYKGDNGNVFHLIQSGRVKQTDVGMGDSKAADVELGPGDWFGEQSLLMKEKSYANITAITDVVTMAMDRETFERCVGPIEALLLRSLREKRLLGIPMFSESLSRPEITHLADQIMEVCYPKGTTIARAGEPSAAMLSMIRHGRLLVYSERDDALFSLQAGDYFGDESVKTHGEYVSKHTVVCEENLTVWTLTRDQIESIVGDVDRLGEIKPYAKAPKMQQFALADLTKHRAIGRGGFGKVCVVSYKDHTGKKEFYALKIINKAKIIDANLHKAVLREKEMLCLLDHPFISSLVASYQDAVNLYLVMPLILGGELYELLRKRRISGRGLLFQDAAFYSGCVLEALGYFHRRDIAYRDLKLENVLIDDDGYPKIIDLGFAKVVTHKTFTMCGTLEYLAPEIILAKGHDTSVDFWAFGVLVYELLAGTSPFFSPGSSQIDTFKRIVKMEYTMPAYFTEAAKDLVKRLLVRQPMERLGSLASGHLGVQRHVWFSDCAIRFKELLAKRITAPWKPQLGNPTSGPNIDGFNGRENMRSLTRTEQELFVGF